MLCYHIPYSHKFGSFTACKWAQTPEDAVALVKKCQSSMWASTGVVTYGKAIPANPQPFEHRPLAPVTELATLQAA